MFYYRRTEPHLWTVGHYDPATSHGWISESDHDTLDKAVARTAMLNGGHVTEAPRGGVILKPKDGNLFRVWHVCVTCGNVWTDSSKDRRKAAKSECCEAGDQQLCYKITSVTIK